MTKPTNGDPNEKYEAWKRGEDAGHLSAEERLKATVNIAVLLSYDLIDKLRFLEKEAAGKPAAEIEAHREQTARLLGQLRAAYLSFADEGF